MSDLPLAEYIRQLVGLLDLHEPAAGARMRQVTREMKASVGLDSEVVEVWFNDTGELIVSEQFDDHRLDGSGWTDRETVVDLLAGRIEASRAILEGRIHVTGATDAIAAVLLAIEILIDGATRIPALQQLAGRLVDSAATTSEGARAGRTTAAAETSWYPRARPDSEEALLTRLGLVAERPPASG